MSEETTQVKISMPLIDNIELQRIDTFYNDIVSEYTKAFVKEKEQVIIQRLMMNLQQENQQLKDENKDLKEKIILLKASEPMLELEKYYGERDKYKEVIEEVRETLINSKEYKMVNAMNLNAKQSVLVELLQILDKVKVDNERPN